MMLLDLIVAAESAPKDVSKDGGNPLLQMVFLFLIFGGLIYFFFIRPQQKQRREQQSMMDSLKHGDQVVTIGGIHGRVEGLKDNVVTLKVADNVKIELSKASIAQVVKRQNEEKSGG